jgi:Ca-activated chloride channel family protein
MSASLPLLRDDESVSGSPGSRMEGEDAGFGALATERGRLPLESMDVSGRIDGLLAQVTVRQAFVNTFDEPLEATYIFPLPDRAAVTAFRMEVGGRLVEGVLQERGQARENYEEAIAHGRRAAIAEEDRPGVFNLRVGNLMPGERAAIELTLCGVLPYSAGEATFRFPLVVAPRYVPGTPLAGPAVGEGTAPDTTAVPDASRISPPVLLPGFPSAVRLSLEVELHDGAALARDVRCSLHAVDDESRDGYRRIRLLPGERLDRDFILRFRLGDTTIRSTLTLHPDAGDTREGTFALTVVPPVDPGAGPPRRRAVVFVLDRSGSMQGWKIVAARRAMARMIDTLGEADVFAVLAFDTVIETPPGLPDGLITASDRNRFRAVEYLAGVGARGGTEMAGPVDRAVGLLAEGPAKSVDRILVLVTDGQVANEDQILATLGKRLRNIRVFTLGIDRAVNEGFLRRLAERGGGACELVESEARLDEVMQSVHRRIGTPLLTGLSLEPAEITVEPGEVVPRRLPDLFGGSPLLILGRYRGRPQGSLTIHANDASGRTYSESVPAVARDNPAIASAWARGQVRQLEDRYAAGDGDRAALERAIVALSLKFHVLCRFTAYVAIDRSRAVNPGGALHQVTQPVEHPQGWDLSQATYTCAGASPPSAFQMLDRLVGYSQTNSVARESQSDLLGDSAALCARPRVASFGFARALNSRFEKFVQHDDTVDSKLASPVPDRSAWPASVSGRFEVRDQIGAGGMGQVFKVHDRERGEEVCLKVSSARGFDAQAVARWRREMGILSGLGHPAFIPVLEADFADGCFWLVTPLVAGRTLAERIRSSGRMPAREAAELVAELAEALQLAHEHGLAHGDIMPANILLGDDGKPRLLGFGELELAMNSAAPGQFIYGNAARMAPEQVRGEVGPRDPRSEIYHLGALLYELLTGQPPFRGEGTEVCARILNESPIPPRRVVRSIPAGLESICMKAIAKDPAARYATAGELAAALRGFLAPARRKSFWK